MYIINVKGSFSAAHYLNNYKGKCEEIHGHNYKVEVSLKGEELQENGILIDFTDLKKDLKNITKYLDHKSLNELPEFSENNPTSENIARFIFESLKLKYDKIYKVRVWETDKQYAEYIKD